MNSSIHAPAWGATPHPGLPFSRNSPIISAPPDIRNRCPQMKLGCAPRLRLRQYNAHSTWRCQYHRKSNLRSCIATLTSTNRALERREIELRHALVVFDAFAFPCKTLSPMVFCFLCRNGPNCWTTRSKSLSWGLRETLRGSHGRLRRISGNTARDGRSLSRLKASGLMKLALCCIPRSKSIFRRNMDRTRP